MRAAGGVRRTGRIRAGGVRRAGRILTAAGSLAAAAGTANLAVNLTVLRTPRLPPPPCRQRVSVLVPARDEERRIGRCLDAVLGQRGIDDLEVLVYDDGSTDATPEIVAAIDDPRLRLLRGSGGPPPGWFGKPHACARLAEAASGAVLVFVDADVVLAPDAVAAAVALLDAHRLDLVSPAPRELADGFGQRLVQPLLQWSWLTFLPLRLAERSPRPSTAVATGQFIAVRRDFYDRAGGHTAIRGEVVDDLALARAMKRAGGRATVADGTRLAECRMYDDWRALADGYGKWLWEAFGSPAGAVAVCGAVVVTYVVPPLAAARGSRVGAAGYLAGVAGRALAARRTASPVWPDALAHPLSVLTFCGLVGRSFALRRRGALAWKGRRLR